MSNNIGAFANAIKFNNYASIVNSDPLENYRQQLQESQQYLKQLEQQNQVQMTVQQATEAENNIVPINQDIDYWRYRVNFVINHSAQLQELSQDPAFISAKMYAVNKAHDNNYSDDQIKQSILDFLSPSNKADFWNDPSKQIIPKPPVALIPIDISKYFKYAFPIISGLISYLLLNRYNFGFNESISASTFIGVTLLMEELNNFDFNLPLTDNKLINRLFTSLLFGLVSSIGVALSISSPIHGLYYGIAIFIVIAIAFAIYYIYQFFEASVGVVDTATSDVIKTFTSKDTPWLGGLGAIGDSVLRLLAIKPGIWWGQA